MQPNNLSIENKQSLIDFTWSYLTYQKDFNTPEKRAELEQEINRLVNLINDFTVKKNYKNFFREKFYQEFKFSGKGYSIIEFLFKDLGSFNVPIMFS